MTMEFDGKVAIVTGATSGIGMATVRKFVEQGGKVAAAGRKKDVLAKIATSNIKTYSVDLLNEQETAAFVQNVLRDFNRIDVLVNAAGIIANGTVENTTLADYDLMMNINVRSVLQLTQLALPSIIEC
jgi:NADP-dependent 3-hydroxy acid dehydrogenase YdfG